MTVCPHALGKNYVFSSVTGKQKCAYLNKKNNFKLLIMGVVR